MWQDALPSRCQLFRFALLLVALTGAAAQAADSPVQLARQGHPLLKVVHAENATSSTMKSAQSLAEYLSRIVGAAFQVGVGDGEFGIVVGTSRDFPHWRGDLPETAKDDQRESYLLRSHARGLVVIGATDLAVEHAVWDLLNRLGYRQFFPGPHWEVVPRVPDLSIAVNSIERPSYYSRHIWYGFGPWDYAREPYSDWCRKNRATNGIELHTGHTGEKLRAQYEQVFQEHPEFLALVNGERSSDKFCISNPGLRQLIVDHALAHFAEHPESDSLSVEPSDGLGWCECPECAKLGSPSTRAVIMANAVATAVSEKHPDKWFGMYAYGGHVAPPAIDVHPRLVVSVATAFGSAGLSFTELMRGWRDRGATLGIREYFAVTQWDRDAPGGTAAARGADLDYLTRTIPEFHENGARFFSAESSDNWGLCGLGYYLASRMLWDVREATPGRVRELRQDFLDRAFGPARGPMDRFYQLIDGAQRPLLSEDLLGRMYQALNEARQLTVDRRDVLTRLDDLVLYTRYLELWFAYSHSTGEQRQANFERLIRHAYRMRETMMVHTLALYRNLPTVDQQVQVPAEAAWDIPEGQNPWKSSQPFLSGEIESFVQQGIARNHLLEFEPFSFSDDLVPATPLALPEVKPGTFGIYHRQETDLLTWAEAAPREFSFDVKAGLIYGRLGDARVALFPRDELQGRAVADFAVLPDQQPHSVALRTTVRGLQRLHLSDGGDATEMIWPAGVPLTIRSAPSHPATLYGRWTLYFYVPRGTRIIGGFSDGIGHLLGPNGRAVHSFSDVPEYFQVPVPAGQDGQLWCFHHGKGLRLLMTVPPYLARNGHELLLPREVVERDSPTK